MSKIIKELEKITSEIGVDKQSTKVMLESLKDFSKKSNSSRSVGWMNCD